MQKRLLIFWLLCLCSVCYSAEDKFWVDVDVVGGDGDGSSLANAYSSLTIAMEARDADITAGNAHFFECYNTAGGADGNASVEFSGTYITDADSYVRIAPDSGYRHAGVYDNSKFRIECTGSDHPFRVAIDYFRIEGIQFKFTTTGTQNSRGIGTIAGIGASNDLRYSNLLVWGVSTSSGWNRAAQSGAANADIQWWNCIFYGAFTWGPYGIGDDQYWNCTVNGCDVGINRGAGNPDIVNCVLFENGDDFLGTFNSVTYTASDDNDEAGVGNFQITQTADDYAALVVDADGGDFSITDGSSELVGTGTDDPGGVIQDDTDIAGTARTSTWDIGAFEFEGEEPPPTGGQVIMITSAIPVILILAICLTIGRIKHEPTQTVNDV